MQALGEQAAQLLRARAGCSATHGPAGQAQAHVGCRNSALTDSGPLRGAAAPCARSGQRRVPRARAPRKGPDCQSPDLPSAPCTLTDRRSAPRTRHFRSMLLCCRRSRAAPAKVPNAGVEERPRAAPPPAHHSACSLTATSTSWRSPWGVGVRNCMLHKLRIASHTLHFTSEAMRVCSPEDCTRSRRTRQPHPPQSICTHTHKTDAPRRRCGRHAAGWCPPLRSAQGRPAAQRCW